MTIVNQPPPKPTIPLRQIRERTAPGRAAVLVEIICERVHCVMYDYAVHTVDMVVEGFGGQVEIQTVVRRGDMKNALRYVALCKKAGKMLSVPTILINGEVFFTNVPAPGELTRALETVLSRVKAQQTRENDLTG